MLILHTSISMCQFDRSVNVNFNPIAVTKIVYAYAI